MVVTVTDEGEFERVELSIPAQPSLLQLVRMTAAVVAARADLELNDVEDLRLAVDELCLPFMGPTGHRGRLLLRYRWDAETIEISCTVTAADEGTESAGGEGFTPIVLERQIKGQAERLRDELSSQILDALVDGHGETTVDGRATVWLRIRRPAQDTRVGESRADAP
jgi:serine/threonine-protein kinase RsbW